MATDDASEGLRARKKRATRKLISDIATGLFTERGFDKVTIDDVAAAANVSKMTVFNYFARKEDLFFDRSDEVRALVRGALGLDRATPHAVTRGGPLVALRTFVHQLVADRHRLVRVGARSVAFWKVVAESAALRARTREMAEELERDLARALAESVEAPAGDPSARLIAAVLVGAWRVAFREALRRHRQASVAAANELLLEMVDRGFAAATAAARGTAYV